MKTKKSCGIVVFRLVKNIPQFLLIQNKFGMHWCIPKGGMKTYESEKETAIREVKEETGVCNIKIMYGFKEKINYFTPDNIYKEVIFFLGETNEYKTIIQLEEINEIKWVSAKEALNILTYEDSKKIIKKSYEYIMSKNFIYLYKK